MDDPTNWFLCSVCGDRTRFCHLSAQICRACASFFRRALTEGIHYECRLGGQCSLSRSRTSCRACRYERCRKAGARLRADNEKSDDPSSPTSSTAITTLPAVILTTRLSEIVGGYESFVGAQRLLLSVSHPGVDFSTDRVLLAKRKDISSLENRSVPLMLSMFHECFGPFSSLPRRDQVTVAAECCFEFALLHRLILTKQIFPSPDDERMVLTVGYYADLGAENMDWYLDGFIKQGCVHLFNTVMGPVIKKRRKNFRKYKLLGLRKVDTVALMFVSLWKHLEYICGDLNDQTARYKERILEEWLEDVRAHVGPKYAPTFVAKALEFYVQCHHLIQEFSHAMTVLNLTAIQNRPKMMDIKEFTERALEESPPATTEN